MTVVDHHTTIRTPRSAEHEPTSEPRSPRSSVTPPARVAAPARDEVDAWGESSFPASDPPGWWAGA